MSQNNSKRDLANPAGPRSVSDKLDNALWKDNKNESCSRGIVHGAWHTGAGIVRLSKDEFSRAGEQFGKCGKFVVKISVQLTRYFSLIFGYKVLNQMAVKSSHYNGQSRIN